MELIQGKNDKIKITIIVDDKEFTQEAYCNGKPFYEVIEYVYDEVKKTTFGQVLQYLKKVGRPIDAPKETAFKPKRDKKIK